MAQTKRKRRTKHRGNAAGMVEARGRTGRKPLEGERHPAGAKPARRDRWDEPPTWSGSAKRAALIAVPLLLIFAFVLGRPAGQVAVLALVLFVTYIPMTYFTDLLLHRRRRAKGSG